jgi:CBS-domain-containing membrane protein
VYLGTFLSSLTGIIITKLFMTNPAMEKYLYLAGALSTATASVVMSLTNSVHPPAGAAAYIAAADDQIRALGWFYLVVQIVTFLIMIGVACIFNNVADRYPLAWWSQEPTGYKLPWYRSPRQ